MTVGMNLFDSVFGCAAMEELFNDAARLQRMLDFEAALATAEARCGIIPAAAAKAIAARCQADLLDLPALAKAAALSLNPAIPLVRQLTDLVIEDDAESARFVHWGATSQDVNDTALVLQMRDAFDLVANDLESLCAGVRTLAEKHRSTPIAGRTMMQHALPTTFGLKAAGWLDALNRHRERLVEVRGRALVLQFGGAVGTLASLHGQGLAVAEALAAELRLKLPVMPWHAHRDRVAEVAAMLGLLTGTLGKIARDLSLHMQTEIAEILEPAAPGRGGSSTMPHKRNPVSAGVVLAAAARVPALVATMLAVMPQEDERGLGNWQAEWETLPQIFRLTGGALHQLAAIVPNLEIDVGRMRRNLDATQGLIFAEAVAFALAERVGKAAAHALVEEASGEARQSGRHLREVLATMKSVAGHLSTAEIDRLFAPEGYLGAAGEFVDRVTVSANRNKQA